MTDVGWHDGVSRNAGTQDGRHCRNVSGLFGDFLWTILNIASTTSFTHYTSVAIAISEFVQMVTSGLTVVWVKYPYILLLLPSFPTMSVYPPTQPFMCAQPSKPM